jgi:hypothetical protein
VSEPDQGQSDAINKGLARCTGDFFNWINSDDYLERGALRHVAKACAECPDAHIISGRTAEFCSKPPIVFNVITLQVRESPEQSIPVGVFCQPSTYWRTEIFREMGGVDPLLHFVFDWDLWVRYLARYGQGKIVSMDHVLAYYRHHPDAKTNTSSNKFYDEAKTVFHNLHLSLDAPGPFLLPEAEKVPGWHRREFSIGPEFDREFYLGCYADRMVRTHRRKNADVAWVWLQRAVRFKPWITLWRLRTALRILLR